MARKKKVRWGRRNRPEMAPPKDKADAARKPGRKSKLELGEDEGDELSQYMKYEHIEPLPPNRHCHDCGKPTSNYRCNECWIRRRMALGLPTEIEENDFDV